MGRAGPAPRAREFWALAQERLGLWTPADGELGFRARHLWSKPSEQPLSHGLSVKAGVRQRVQWHPARLLMSLSRPRDVPREWRLLCDGGMSTCSPAAGPAGSTGFCSLHLAAAHASLPEPRPSLSLTLVLGRVALCTRPTPRGQPACPRAQSHGWPWGAEATLKGCPPSAGARDGCAGVSHTCAWSVLSCRLSF